MRNDRDDQVFGSWLPIQAPSLQETRTLLSVAAGGPIMITISEIRACRRSLGDGLPVKAYMLESYLLFILERSDGGGNYTGNFDPFRGDCLLGFSYMAYGPDMRKRVA